MHRLTLYGELQCKLQLGSDGVDAGGYPTEDTSRLYAYHPMRINYLKFYEQNLVSSRSVIIQRCAVKRYGIPPLKIHNFHPEAERSNCLNKAFKWIR